MIHGFSNPDTRNKLKDSPHLKDIADPRRETAQGDAHFQSLPR